MKFLASLFVLFGFASAFADGSKHVNFSYDTYRSAYRCGYAKDQAESVLVQLGATNVKTECAGGIQDNGPDSIQPILMTITFDQNITPSVVNFSGNESCDFNVRLIDDILKSYDHKSIKKSESCWDARGRYAYSVQL